MFSWFETTPIAPVRRHYEVAGRRLALCIREHQRAKRITLRIEPGGQALRLTVPPGMAQREIDAFLTRHEGWMMTKLAALPTDCKVGEGMLIPIGGIDHRITRSGKLRGLAKVITEGDVPALMVSGGPEHVGRRVADHLKRVARQDLEKRVNHYAEQIGRTVRAISVKDTKSRWGSCTSDGRLSFSWRLAMAPPLVTDYLAAHEVAHLAEMNHSPAFWSLCRDLCPNTNAAKSWLKAHGSGLQALQF
ncbi:M48 family metallopeptidase [Pseudohoeflea coraliihabitans]|uniref:M48 family metallopeptidase n=1 Tax=Pseudohoeflea coraliihabitans TaxID=2860393 RepID=A0ABS6WTY3_9HYPH|nr:SprT family zinc-dependent metalloprotease [Pseudohoeflea sp. DP4N28-3]MBW3099093.1 M48 family metallopeptidase [Pseudohoeflea sp. DP4N28-3]